MKSIAERKERLRALLVRVDRHDHLLDTFDAQLEPAMQEVTRLDDWLNEQIDRYQHLADLYHETV